MVQCSWLPALSGEGAAWLQVLNALERDAAAADLPPGTRLPPQRELAFRLGLSVGTVSRAYAEAERRGLVESQVGRGTFVSRSRLLAPTHRPTGRINLAMNVPPVAP